VENLERLEKENRRKAKEEKQKTTIMASASSLSKNSPGSSFYTSDVLFLSPDFIFDKLIFSSSQVNAAFASILAELPERSKDA
jgi:hypothetical protein